MDVFKIISATENMEGITFHLLGSAVDGKSTIEIVTYAYDDEDFEWALEQFNLFNGPDSPV